MRAALEDSEYLRYSSRIKYLGFVVLGYQVVVQGIGVVMVWLYMWCVSSAKEVLEKKGLKMLTFSVFTVVSTFVSCGFVPTNENMVVFCQKLGASDNANSSGAAGEHCVPCLLAVGDMGGGEIR